MLVLPNTTAGLASSSSSTQFLFSIYLLTFVAMVISGFLTWTVIRVTDRLHGLGNFLIVSTALVNCVFGSPLVLLNMVSLANSGSWWFGVESCVLGQVIESCVHAGTAWVLAAVAIVWCHSQYQYPTFRWQKICLRATDIVAVAGVWVIGCAIGILSTVASAGVYHVKDGIYSSWTCTPNHTTATHSAMMFTLAFTLPLAIAFACHIASTVRLRRKVFSQLQPMGSLPEKELLSKADDAETMDLPTANGPASVDAEVTLQPVRTMSQPNLAIGNPCEAPTVPKLMRRPGSVTGMSDVSRKVQNRSLTPIPSQNPRPHKRSSRLTPLTPVSLPKLETPESAFPPWFGQPLPSQAKPLSVGSFTGSDPLTSDISPIISSDSSFSSQTINNMLEQGTMASISSKTLNHELEQNTMSDSSQEILHKVIEDETINKGSTDRAVMDDKPTKFLYKRSELLKDCDNWLTVFLTADVNQTLTPSSSPELYIQRQTTPEQGEYPGGKPSSRTCSVAGEEIPSSTLQSGYLTIGSTKRINVRPINEESSVAYANDFEEYHQLKRFWYLLISHLFLWLPHYVILVTMVTNPSPDLGFEGFVMVELTGKVAMVINPLLFFLFQPDFRQALRNVIACRDPNGYANEDVQLA